MPGSIVDRNEKVIQYFYRPMRVACDRNCQKAWGVATRPKIQLSDDPDDIVYFADGELPVAPVDPGTYEGQHAKPLSPDEFPNKWCVRECERLSRSEKWKWKQPLLLKDWSQRRFNQPWKHTSIQAQ